MSSGNKPSGGSVLFVYLNLFLACFNSIHIVSEQNSNIFKLCTVQVSLPYTIPRFSDFKLKEKTYDFKLKTD